MNALLPRFEALAAGDARHRFSIDDVYAMFKAGVLDEGAREELIEGELVEMPADGARHKACSADLGRWLLTSLSREFMVIPSSTLVLSEFNAPSPDWQVFDRSKPIEDVRGGDVLLAIEQSDSSIRRDLGWKADLYARYGVRDYWVIDLNADRIHVHRGPGEEGYAAVTVHDANARVEALLIPGLRLRMAELSPLYR